MANITPAQLRTDFPAFGDVDVYPDASINIWAAAADVLLDATAWGDLLNIGQELFIAHNLVLDGMGNVEGQRGGIVGFAKGPVSSESGDKVSISYAAQMAMQEGAGHWNATTYGQRYWSLMRMVGTGVVQVSPSPFGGIAGPGGYGWNYGNPGNMQF